MTTGVMLTGYNLRVLNNGVMAPFAKIYTYASGTNTPLATYTDAGLTTPATNPLVCNAYGEITAFLGPSNYRLTPKTSADIGIGSPIDNIQGAYLTSSAAALVYADINTPIRGGTVTSTVATGVRTFAMTLNPAISSYADRDRFLLTPNAVALTDTGYRININGVGESPLYDAYSGDILPGMLSPGVAHDIIYSSGYGGFVVQGVSTAFVSIGTAEVASDRLLYATTTDSGLTGYHFIAAKNGGISRTIIPSAAADSIRWVEMNADATPITLKLKTQTISTSAVVNTDLSITKICELV